MEHRRLGRTGHESTVAVLGGAAFARCSPAEADEGFHLAIERGVNHLDIAPSYGDAEVRVGPHIPAVRDRLFLAAKTHRRSRDGVRAQLATTLERMGTDHLDLYQLHGVTDLDDVETRSDAADEILAARDEGLVRFVGVTGHDVGTPAAQLEAVRRWDLDTVMFPVYPAVWADPAYRAAAEALLAEAALRDLGVMVIKAAAHQPWGSTSPWATTWYEPWSDDQHLANGVGFALSTPGVHAFCTASDLALLPRLLDAAEAVQPMSPETREALVADAAGTEVIFPLTEKAVGL